MEMTTIMGFALMRHSDIFNSSEGSRIEIAFCQWENTDCILAWIFAHTNHVSTQTGTDMRKKRGTNMQQYKITLVDFLMTKVKK